MMEAETGRQQLVEALARNEIFHVYQPIISLSDSATTHCEALARWMHPTLGEVGPDAFLSLIHGAGLSGDFTDYGLALALGDLPTLRTFHGPDVAVAVNLSHQQLLRPEETATRIEAALARSNESPKSLCIEVVEDLGRMSIGPTTEAFAHLRELGVTVFLDDFGTGASSLTQLTEMAYDGIKIDRSFVAGLPSSSTAQSVIGAIIAFGADTGISIVGEGIESALEYNLLAEMGCEFGQGYFIERPKSIGDVRSLSIPVAPLAPRAPQVQSPAAADIDSLRDEIASLNPRATTRPPAEFEALLDKLETRAHAMGDAADVLLCEIGRKRTLNAIYTNDYDGVRRNALNTSILAERIGEWGYSAEALGMLAATNPQGLARDSGLRIEALTKALELRFTKPIDGAKLSSVDNSIGAAFANLGLWSRAGAWWRATVEIHGDKPYQGAAIACINIIEIEINALEGDAWFISDTPDELRHQLVAQMIGQLEANPYAPDGVTDAFRCRLHLLAGDIDAARNALSSPLETTEFDVVGEFLGSLARAKLARATGDFENFLKHAARQVDVLAGHSLLTHHAQLAQRLLAEAHLAVGEPEKSVAILLESYDHQFFADSRRLKSLFNWVRLHSDLNARVAELLEIGVVETSEILGGSVAPPSQSS